MVKGGYKEVRIGPKTKLIPEEWKVKKLKKIIKKRKGKRPNKLFESKDGENFIPYLSVNYLRGNDLPEWCLKNDDNKVEVKENEILMIWDGSYSGNVFIGFNGALSSTMARLKCEDDINNQYLFYQLRNNFKIFQSTTIGTSVPHVAGKVFENLNIPTPEKKEQKKIASILSSVDKSIEKIDELIEETKELKKGLMQELFTKGIEHSEFKEVNINGKTMKLPIDWDIKMLKDVTEINKNNISTRTSEDYTIEYIDISSINDIGKIEETTFYNYGNAPSRAKRLVNIDDVIVSTVRPYLKSFAIIEEDKENLVCSTGFAVLTPKLNMETEYIYYFAWSNHFVNYMKRLMRGTSYPAVNKNDVANTFIPVPPLAEQKKIASILSSVDAKIKKEKEYKAKLERLKKGLMQKLLTGEIRVNTEMEV